MFEGSSPVHDDIRLELPATKPELGEVLRTVSFYLMLLLIFILPFRGWITISEGVTIAVPLGGLVGGVWGASVILNSTIRRPDLFHLLLGLFVVWMGVTSIWSIGPGESLLTTIRFGLYLLIGLAFWDVFRTHKLIELALFAYVLGASLTMMVELYYFFAFELARVRTLSNPNYLAGRLLFALPFAWYFAFNQSESVRVHYRFISVGYLFALIPTIIWTQSRQGLIAMLVGILVLMAFTDRLRKYLVVLPVIFVGIIVYARSFMGERFGEIMVIIGEILTVVSGGTVTDPTTGRVTIIEGTFDLLLARPITGYGIGNFSMAFDAMHGVARTAHNSYLAVSVETGLVGLALFLLILFELVRGVSSRHQTGLVLGFLAVWAVLSLTNDWHTGFAAWGNFFLILCIARISNSPSYNGSSKI